MFKVDFRAPLDDLDCPEEHSHLVKKMGYPWVNIPKMVHGMRVCDKTGHVMYLVSWQQDFQQYFYTPSWTLGSLLMSTPDGLNMRLIAEFYHSFAEEMDL